jgi:hypothetical protein
MPKDLKIKQPRSKVRITDAHEMDDQSFSVSWDASEDGRFDDNSKTSIELRMYIETFAEKPTPKEAREGVARCARQQFEILRTSRAATIAREIERNRYIGAFDLAKD